MRDLHTHRGLGRVFHVEQSPYFDSLRYAAKRPHRQMFHVEQLRKWGSFRARSGCLTSITLIRCQEAIVG